MKLLPLNNAELIELVAQWLGKEDNCRWLDFGHGVQQITAVTLKVMSQQDFHLLRAYTADADDLPIGVVGLSNVDRKFKTASLWAVLGNKRYGGWTTPACARVLTTGFTELGLEAVNAWTVETNIPAQRVLERLHFRYIGRQRRCHHIDGRSLDRLLFDLLAVEHQGTSHAGLEQASAADLHPVR